LQCSLIYLYGMEMTSQIERQRLALELIDRIVKLEPDHGTTAHAMKMRERLRLPMSVVLEKLWPELSVMDKVRRLNITRQAYYGWLNGLYRPDAKLAKELAKHTGYAWEDIRGRSSDR
jgi:hypothetical protein